MEKELPVSIEGIAAILFQVVDVDDPIEEGGETTYEIRVLNQGSKAATNVRMAVQVPPEMRAVAAEGPHAAPDRRQPRPCSRVCRGWPPKPIPPTASASKVSSLATCGSAFNC